MSKRRHSAARWVLTVSAAILLVAWKLNASGYFVWWGIVGGTHIQVVGGLIEVGRSRLSGDVLFIFDRNWIGISWSPYFSSYPDGWGIDIPIWMPVLLLAAPMPWLWANELHHRFRTIPPGACRFCRYDCRGLPTGSPCPECGKTSRPRI